MTDRFAATRAATEAAIQQVEDNADEAWKASALEAIIWCARRLETFTADEVWERLDELNIPGPHTPSALGPMFLQAKRAGVIENTGQWQPLSRFARRHRALQIWRSLSHNEARRPNANQHLDTSMTIIDRATLLAKLDATAPALASSGSIPLLQNFLFTGERLIAYDDYIGIAVPLATEFTGAVPGKLLHDVVADFTHAKDIELREQDQHLLIGAVGYRSAARPPVLTRAPFEQVFKMPNKPRSGYVPDAAFFTAIDNCLQSVSAFATVTERLGVTLVPDRDQLLLYATDGGTVSHARLPTHPEFKARCTLSLAFCAQMLRLKDAESKLLSLAPDHVLFAADDVLLFSRLLAVEQPMDYARILKKYLPNAFPDGVPTPTAKERARMKIAFELAALMTDGKTDERTDINISGGKLRLHSANTTRGEASDLLWYRAHPDTQCGAVMERVLKGFNRYDNLLIRNDVVLCSSGANVYLVAAMR